MREIVIVIADLYLPHGTNGAPPGAAAVAGAAPGIESAGRFGQRAALEHGWREWLAHALGRADLAGAAPACIAAAEVAPAGPAVGASGTLWIATPLHLSAGAAPLVLDHRGVLRLPQAELATLAAAFQDTFGVSGFTLTPLSSGDFLLRTAGMATVATTEPARCAGRDLAAALPRGAAAAPLRRLLAEIEMWLHGQALNEARRRRGEPPVTSLWPWGAEGRAVQPERLAARPMPRAFGADPYVSGLWRLQADLCRALPGRLEDVLPEERARGLVLVVEVGRELQPDGHDTLTGSVARLDARFVSPALTALRRGEVASVTLIANDTRITLRRRSHLRLWRRPRAGLRSFA
ncbi:MAG: hypothetical protein E6K50_03850 [Gammaproteobacteria bacterium]|nr:MAG: hypothetical protein E6K50_03850 [Gammaproteobacteria bacterium]